MKQQGVYMYVTIKVFTVVELERFEICPISNAAQISLLYSCYEQAYVKSLPLYYKPLQMGVTGNNLLNVSKLIFSISRSEHNDKLFDEEEMIQPIVKLLGIIELSDALVYILGAVKLLAGNVTLRAKLVNCGVINCLVVVLEKITEVCAIHVLRTRCVSVWLMCMCVCVCVCVL